MKVEIFYIKDSQQELYENISRMIRRIIYFDVSIVGYAIERDYRVRPGDEETTMHKHASRYLELLKLSILRIRNEDFDVVVWDDDDTYYYYLGGKFLETMNFLNLYQRYADKIFPAIAIMNHMSLLPEQISSAFDMSESTYQPSAGSQPFSWCPKPLEADGVSLVNFHSEVDIANGLIGVSRYLKSSFSRICSRHMIVRGIDKPDFDELAGLLDVPKDFLKENQIDIVKPFVTVKITPETPLVYASRDNEVKFIVDMHASTSVESAILKISSPADVLRSDAYFLLSFNSTDHKSVPISFIVNPKTPPFLPLEFSFSIDSSINDFTPPPIPVFIEVCDAEIVPGPK